MITKRRKNLIHLGMFAAISVSLLLAVTSCTGPAGTTGPTGPAGPAGANGVSTGTFSGKVTNSLTNAPLSGATLTVTADPSIKAVTATTGSDGSFSTSLPIGTYSVSIASKNFTATTQTVTIIAGQTSTRDVALAPTAKVIVSAGAAQTTNPGTTVALKATTTIMDNSTNATYQWTQVSGVKATIDKPTSDSIQVTLATATDYKQQLLGNLTLLERWVVQAINPEALILARDAVFKVTVTTSSGSYSGTVTVTANLPYAVNPGLRNVPINVPVLLHGKTQPVYKWSITAPTGSKAILDNTKDQNPSFTPDVVGKYTITETQSGATLDVFGGTWTGAISGINASGKPLAANCTICHDGKTAPNQFADWSVSGHAAILTDNLNTSTHYGEACFECHSVGFDKAAINGGMDDATDYVAFIASGMINKPSPLNWKNMVTNYPKAAKLANIQCENCHGPDNNTAHPGKSINVARISLSADVCGVCHGEPPRHGRFQQWAESAHGNYETAIAEGTRASCTRCHSAQGFFAWLKQGKTTNNLTLAIQGAKGDATTEELAAMGITANTVDPITCVVCHEPHAVGTTTGLTTDAQPRIRDNTALLPSGYSATIVGKGAICITCHNTRNAEKSDFITPTSFATPHNAAQGDVLMGENAYFVTPERSPHSAIEDTCVTCHLGESPAPADYSLPGNGTNHGFTASIEICKECHSETLNGEAFQAGTKDKLATLASLMGKYLLNKLPDTVTVTDAGTATHQYNGKTYTTASSATTIQKNNIVSISMEYFGRNMPFTINLKTPVNFTYAPAGETAHTVAVSKIVVQLSNIKNGDTAVISFTDPLNKAGWNYTLINVDASFGIHNPNWVNDVLNATVDALK